MSEPKTALDLAEEYRHAMYPPYIDRMFGVQQRREVAEAAAKLKDIPADAVERIARLEKALRGEMYDRVILEGRIARLEKIEVVAQELLNALNQDWTSAEARLAWCVLRTALVESRGRSFKCACGWKGKASFLKENASRIRVCPDCGASGGLVGESEGDT